MLQLPLRQNVSDPSEEIRNTKQMCGYPPPRRGFGGTIVAAPADHRKSLQPAEAGDIGAGGEYGDLCIPAAFDGDIPGEGHDGQRLHDSLGSTARDEIACRRTLGTEKATADNVPLPAARHRAKAVPAMIDELDQIGRGCGLFGCHGAIEEIPAQSHIIFYDDGYFVAAGQKLAQGHQVAAVAAVFTGQDGSAMPPLKARVVDIDPLRPGDKRAVDAIDALEPEIEFAALPLNFRQPIRRSVDVDQIDWYGLSRLKRGFGECSYGHRAHLSFSGDANRSASI
ncbi:hypothetical protein RHSP_25532 [Rhizobium freirei PRF 81]|uniref:Uncharacterized protein n=1 Tax=Rhizobium freirei PRF 81 TaxID=363754 RepID=N6UAR0_9HYPH|nr:hypothetical protein RHSP_25532 [Rhizobium freirei PRF 81]